MKRGAILLLLLVLGAGASHGQWQFGSSLSFGTANTFTWENGSDLVPWQTFGANVFGEYRFRERSQSAFRLQNALRIDLQSTQFSTNTNGQPQQNNAVRIPVQWVHVIPRLLQGEEHPLLEMVSSVGGYVGATASTVSSERGFGTYGVLADLGINFYIQTGSRFYIGYNFIVDLGTFDASDSVGAQQFASRAFTLGFSSSIPDTRARMRAMRERRSARN